MDYYALQKLCTPGDLIVAPNDTSILIPSGWVAGRDAWFLGASETLSFADTGENRMPHKMQRANAVMLKHRWNNFNIAVSGLKLVLQNGICPFCGRDNSDTEGCTSDDCEGVKLVKQLEEIPD
jgi:hypothetical protein